MVLVDTNVIIDIMSGAPVWASRSEAALGRIDSGVAGIGPIVYAELAAGIARRNDLDAALLRMGLSQFEMSFDAYFNAGRAHAAYRARGGVRASILPDFFIGAHAAALGCPLLTRDPKRYRTAFPDVPLIEP